MTTWYGLPYSVGTNKCMALICCDDTLFHTMDGLSSNTYILSSSGSSELLTELNRIDSFFGSATWAAVKCPLSASFGINVARLAADVYPAAVWMTAANGMQIYDEDGVQKDTAYLGYESGNWWRARNGGLQYNPGLPFGVRYDNSVNETKLYVFVFIANSSAVVDGKLVAPLTNIRCVRIEIEKANNKWYGQLQFYPQNSNVFNTWAGCKVSEAFTPIPDPYEEGGTSEENLGGNGSFDDGSDQINDSTLPTISAANTGFTRIYNPTLAQVQALANYLWTDQTIIQTLWNHVKQFLENPMDAFIAFNLVPCAVPDGGTTEFKVMYIGTGVNMTAAASQFVDVDCGTLDIDEYYGSALDYAPNTKISVFLPFIGTVQLDTDDVMGKTIGVKYRIDIVSGGCVAKIIVDGSIHYQYSGHCAVNIPFTSADYTGYISAMLQAAKVGSTIASAGASAAAATAEEGVAIPEMAAAGASAAEMMEASKAYDRRIAASGAEGAAQATFSSLAPKNISNTVGVVMSSKPVVERSGSFSGNTGYLGIRRPFCIIERPRMCNPSDYGKYNGRPAMLTMSLGDCSGFTKVQQVQLTGIPATNPELDEIGAFLKGGVIL